MAMACPVPYATLKMPGSTAPMVAVSLGSWVPLTVATRSAGPAGTVQGTWKLTWALETNKSGAGIPPTVMEKLPRVAGRGMVVAFAVADPNPTPNRDAKEPGASGWPTAKEAPFWAPVSRGPAPAVVLMAMVVFAVLAMTISGLPSPLRSTTMRSVAAVARSKDPARTTSLLVAE